MSTSYQVFGRRGRSPSLNVRQPREAISLLVTTIRLERAWCTTAVADAVVFAGCSGLVAFGLFMEIDGTWPMSLMLFFPRWWPLYEPGFSWTSGR
jgi:hypothetical protein